MVLRFLVVRIGMKTTVIFFQNFSTNFRTRTGSFFVATEIFYMKNVNFALQTHGVA